MRPSGCLASRQPAGSGAASGATAATGAAAAGAAGAADAAGGVCGTPVAGGACCEAALAPPKTTAARAAASSAACCAAGIDERGAAPVLTLALAPADAPVSLPAPPAGGRAGGSALRLRPVMPERSRLTSAPSPPAIGGGANSACSARRRSASCLMAVSSSILRARLASEPASARSSAVWRSLSSSCWISFGSR